MAFATWKRDERKKQVPTKMNPQKMWQTWSLSDLAGEPNPSNGSPLVNKLRSRPYWDFKGDEVVATDDVWGRYKKN